MGGTPDPISGAMGATNVKHGVCGFTTALYALHHHQPEKRATLTTAAKQHSRMAAEIKSFLVELSAGGDALTLTSIEEFTGKFEGYEGFKIVDYIRKVNSLAKSKPPAAKADASEASQLPGVPDREDPDSSSARDGASAASSPSTGPRQAELNLSIGMPDAALVKYLKYIGFDQAKKLDAPPPPSDKGELILGLSYPKSDPKKRTGLAHYVYQRDGVIYNAGKTYASIGEIEFPAPPGSERVWYDEVLVAIAVKGEP